jgi:WD40 repeat protein
MFRFLVLISLLILRSTLFAADLSETCDDIATNSVEFTTNNESTKKTPVTLLVQDQGGHDRITATASNNDGSIFLVGNSNGELSAWDSINRLVTYRRYYQGRIRDVQLNQALDFYVVATTCNVHLVRYQDHAILQSKHLGNVKINQVAISKSGKYLAIATVDRVYLWKIGLQNSSAKLDTIFSRRFYDIFGIEFSPDEASLLVASGDNMLLLSISNVIENQYPHPESSKSYPHFDNKARIISTPKKYTFSATDLNGNSSELCSYPSELRTSYSPESKVVNTGVWKLFQIGEKSYGFIDTFESRYELWDISNCERLIKIDRVAKKGVFSPFYQNSVSVSDDGRYLIFGEGSSLYVYGIETRSLDTRKSMFGQKPLDRIRASHLGDYLALYHDNVDETYKAYESFDQIDVWDLNEGKIIDRVLADTLPSLSGEKKLLSKHIEITSLMSVTPKVLGVVNYNSSSSFTGFFSGNATRAKIYERRIMGERFIELCDVKLPGKIKSFRYLEALGVLAFHLSSEQKGLGFQSYLTLDIQTCSKKESNIYYRFGEEYSDNGAVGLNRSYPATFHSNRTRPLISVMRDTKDKIDVVALSHEGQLATTISSNGLVFLYRIGKTSNKLLDRFYIGRAKAKAAAVTTSQNVATVAIGNEAGELYIVSTKQSPDIVTPEFKFDRPITELTFSGDGQKLVVGFADFSFSYISLPERKLLFTVRYLDDLNWLAFNPGQFFDTNDYRRIDTTSWKDNSSSGNVLSLASLAKQFFKPNLIGRSYRGAAYKAPSKLTSIEGTSPVIKDIALIGQTRGLATFKVSILTPSIFEGATPIFEELQLYRDGNLVSMLKSNTNMQVNNDLGTTDFVFEGIQLPANSGTVSMGAIAFNANLIRSDEYASDISIPIRKQNVQKTFVFSMGINNFDHYRNLSFAENDAIEMVNAFQDFTNQSSGDLITFAAVDAGSDQLNENTIVMAPEKNTVLALFDHLAGRNRNTHQGTVPYSNVPVPAPGDNVILTFSSHGARFDEKFYIATRDSQTDAPATHLSMDDLYERLVFLDGNITIILDTCYSGSSVQNGMPAFFADANLGQLAFQKRMRVLTASSEQNVAFETKALGNGYLTYALVKDGVLRAKADTNEDGAITLPEWLAYGGMRLKDLMLMWVEQNLNERDNLDRDHFTVQKLSRGAAIISPVYFDYAPTHNFNKIFNLKE